MLLYLETSTVRVLTQHCLPQTIERFRHKLVLYECFDQIPLNLNNSHVATISVNKVLINNQNRF